MAGHDLDHHRARHVGLVFQLHNLLPTLNPPVLLADEPTGSLDSEAGNNVLDLLERIREERRATLVLVTHDADVVERADRVVRMLDGRLDLSPTPSPLALRLAPPIPRPVPS